MKLSAREFDKVVKRAIKRIPLEIQNHLKNILISIRSAPSKRILSEMGLPADYPLLGLYQGTPLMERISLFPPLYPDTILIFQKPLEEACQTVDELEMQIEVTVVHEIAHFVGISDERLKELGYG